MKAGASFTLAETGEGGGERESSRAPQTTTANYRNEAHPTLDLFLLNKLGWRLKSQAEGATLPLADPSTLVILSSSRFE